MSAAVLKGFNKLLSHLISRRTLHYIGDRSVVELCEGYEYCRKTGDIGYYNAGKTEYLFVLGETVLHGLAFHHELPEAGCKYDKEQSCP